MKKAMLITAVVAAMAGSAVAQPALELRFGFEAPGSFWYHAPTDLHARIGFLENRVNRERADGRLNPGAYETVHNDLGHIHSMYDGYMQQDHGRLTQDHQVALWHYLQQVSDRLNWNASYGY